MSQDAVQAFIKKMKTEEAFREKIFNQVDDVEERIKLANASGFDFTIEELRAAGKNADGIADLTSASCF